MIPKGTVLTAIPAAVLVRRVGIKVYKVGLSIMDMSIVGASRVHSILMVVSRVGASSVGVSRVGVSRVGVSRVGV